PEFYLGAHWQMADPSIAVDRRMKCRARMSERNKALGMAWHNYNVTGEGIRAECDCHLDDPIIEALCPANDKSPSEITALSGKSVIQEADIVELRKLFEDRENRYVN
ncbi:MAG: hypothetical protein NTZ34_11280, partial [Chloroflexi bacterium]|nr:hypothetical protein [Chloroflexota bacterium]